MVVAGGAAVAALIVYFWVFGDPSTLSSTLAYNGERMSGRTLGLGGVIRGIASVATQSVWTIGGVLLLAAGAAPILQRRSHRLLVVLTCYLIATLAFNLILFRMPGSGTYYLQSVIPAVAILAGSVADAAMRFTASLQRGLAVLAVAAITQIAGAPPSLSLGRSTDAARVAANYVATHADPSVGVLALTPAIQFYAGNPVAVIPFVPQQVLLDSLSSPGPSNIGFVVIDKDTPPAGTERFASEWSDRLTRNFALAPVDAPGVLVYERSAPQATRLDTRWFDTGRKR
jgi:hypothetical protein